MRFRWGMLGGQCYDPVGRAIIDAQLSGKILSLRTSFERSEAEDLHHHLKTGLSSSWRNLRKATGGAAALGATAVRHGKARSPQKRGLLAF
jgi:hypothetical protein